MDGGLLAKAQAEKAAQAQDVLTETGADTKTKTRKEINGNVQRDKSP